MNRDRVLDRVRWAGNVAARVIGQQSVAYRPRDAWHPLAPAGAYIRLPVAFTNVGGKFDRPTGYDSGLFTGIFDSSYTQPGDYLVSGERRWFIASQDPFLPCLCVETNRHISFARVDVRSGNGAGGYSGITAASKSAITGLWPANMVERSATGNGAAALPTDVAASYWTVLLPPIPTVTLAVSDHMTDDLGRNGIVVSAELGRLGWRLTVKSTTV